jgi:hypothetical protein
MSLAYSMFGRCFAVTGVASVLVVMASSQKLDTSIILLPDALFGFGSSKIGNVLLLFAVVMFLGRDQVK